MSLKTDFLDAIPAAGAGTLRKYQQINNSDGTVSFQDVTEYSQVGDKAQASIFNQICDAINKGAYVPLSCTKSGTVYALTGLSATSGKIPVMFSAPTAFAAGDTVTIDGTAYTLKTTDGSALTNGAWAAEAFITGTADVDSKVLYVEPSDAKTVQGVLIHPDTENPTPITGSTLGWMYVWGAGSQRNLYPQKLSDSTVGHANYASGSVPLTTPGLRNIVYNTTPSSSYLGDGVLELIPK